VSTKPTPQHARHLSMPFSHTLDRLDVSFDDAHSVANAGLILPATLAAHLGIEEAANQGRRPR
jgi:hypothetical protein